MTLAFSLTKSAETLNLAGSLSGENARKSAGSEGADGFAEMLGQLASLVQPVTAAGVKGTPGLPDRQDAGLPTGKTLPVAGKDLEIAGFESDVPVVAGAIDAIVLLPGLVPGAVEQGGPHAAPPLTSIIPTPATPAAPAAPVNSVSPVNVASPATGSATAAPLTAAELPGAAGEAAKPGFDLRIVAASAPRPAAPLAQLGAEAAIENGRARIELPGTTPQSERSAVAAPAAPIAAVGRANVVPPVAQAPVTATEGDMANAAQSAMRADSGAAPSKSERPEQIAPARMALTAGEGDKAAGDDSAADQSLSQNGGGARHPAQADASRILANTLVTRAPESATGFGTVMATNAAASTATVDAVGQVERVVEQLMAARQFDLSKPTAVAVAHKEFGALTLTFGQSNDGMKVEIAAADSEAHRALAAAMANDRGPQRAQDQQAAPSATQQNQAERGNATGNNQSSTGFGPHSGAQSGAQSGEGQRSGDNARSAHADPRSRRGDAPAGTAQSGASTAGDDALYA